ncbi:MAG: flagellar assembly protein T N-terminal domain-containing protein [Proteobacteria bacterium]|nr:flagellar assembly protein T N-terminal domain-containing protein [Pseudomonadota bacterium]
MTGFIGRLCLFIFIMLSWPLQAADDQLQMITATGRAVISHSDALNEAKNAALEDALYLAALSGGAKIDGFSSIQADTALDDHFVVRPSSEILDYNIIDEMHDDQHYQVTVQAAVGTVEREGCQNRMVGHISMFAPSYSLTRHVPGWLSTTPQLMVRTLYDRMASQPELTLTNYAGTKLDVGALLKDARYDYQTLTSSRPNVADGDFAFATEISFGSARVDKGLHQQHFLDVTITSHMFSGSRYQNLGDVTHSSRIKTGGTSINQTISTLAAPKRSDIQEALLQLVDTHAKALSQTMLCLPLSATMTQRDDGLYVSIGARQGLGPNHLAVVSGHMTPWTILRVTKSDANGATLMPLNRQRNLAKLNGQTVTFLEFN